MSFEVRLGVTESPRNKISKSLVGHNWTYTLEGTLRDACSIMNPSIEIRTGQTTDIALPTLSKCNYMYIPNFNRYYFITDITSYRNTLAIVHGHVDVLKTFEDQIKDNTALVKRASDKNYYTKMLDDGCFKVRANPHIVVKRLTGDTFTNKGEFVLAVSGSGGGITGNDSKENSMPEEESEVENVIQ